MSHFVAYILQFQEIIMYKIPPVGVGRRGSIASLRSIPIYGKNLKNLLLWNQKVDDLESWYAALGTQVLPNVFK